MFKVVCLGQRKATSRQVFHKQETVKTGMEKEILSGLELKGKFKKEGCLMGVADYIAMLLHRGTSVYYLLIKRSSELFKK